MSNPQVELHIAGFGIITLELDAEKLSGKVVVLPSRDDIDLTIEEHLIVEYYSR